MKRVRLSRRAVADLEDIWLYVAQDSSAAADQLLDRISHACQKLADTPRLGRPRDELVVGLRSLPVGDYLVFYRPAKDGIEVARILNGYRDLDAIFGL